MIDAGDRLTRMFEEAADELMGTLYFMLGNREDAREALQESFLKCWRRRASLDEVRDMRAWVFKVAIDAARDMRRSAWHRRRRPLPEDEKMIPTAIPEAVTQVPEQAETVARVRCEIGKLPDSEREVFLLRENGGLSYKDIAAICGAPLGTVKTRMRSALIRLRRALTVPESSLRGETT
jgi:RNA polymerase sigma factor (sigma-70 family)